MFVPADFRKKIKMEERQPLIGDNATHASSIPQRYYSDTNNGTDILDNCNSLLMYLFDKGAVS